MYVGIQTAGEIVQAFKYGVQSSQPLFRFMDVYILSQILRESNI
jgi:hypothetical protein